MGAEESPPAGQNVTISSTITCKLYLSIYFLIPLLPPELSSTLMEKMQDIEDKGQFFRYMPTTTLVGIGALTAVLAYWLATRPRPIQAPCSLLHQSEEVPQEDGGRRSMIGDSSKLLSHYHDDARTMYEVFQRGLHISGDGPCLGSRLPDQPYKWISYKEVTARAEYLGSGLLHQGCRPDPSQFIGVFAQNRPEWIISELACYTYSMVVVPLYDTLGPDAIRFIINTADISTVICDKVDKAQVLLDNVERKETPGLRRIILMDGFESDLVRRGEGCGVLVQAMQEVEALGRDHCRTPVPPAPDDLSIVCFTSGTTGNNSVVYCHGGRIGACGPTIFPGVPRLLNRMYDKIFSQANTPLKRWLLNFAARRKGAEVSSGIIRSDSVWDKIFFSKIQASLGGRLRMIVTGAAPTSPSVLGFLRAALGCQVYEAYGQTECTAGCTFTTPGDWTPGHVGAPLPCNLIKLVDVPEKNYFASKGEGEVCVKGPNVFKGYLKDPERTAETLDAAGWLHTGDIGKWLPVRIIDRKKHIFKLAQGEYISPEKIENIYIRSEPVAQLYVHGDSLKSCLVGIVVPDPEVMPEWAKKKGIFGTYKDLCKNTELKKAVLEDLVRLGKTSGLHSFEQVKNIYIHSEMFSILNGLLTPTLKAKRPELKEFFKEKIDQLYDSISM
uniref:Arachidonate--CoA ligase n=1 Tax=Gasterosteus aculeatus aculeatus TaxID=481459 RepID=A0AAQ4PIF7_GASAC